jgi:tetratricopeptide (TPR) repeat protein
VTQATTPSIEAFQAYAQGMEQNSQGSPMQLRFFQRATELDPEFAVAHLMLGAAYWSTGDWERFAEYANKAYSLIGRAESEPERLKILGYHYFVTGQWDKAEDTFQLYKSTYTRDVSPRAALGTLYLYTGQWERALQEDQEHLKMYRTQPSYVRMILDYVYLNRFHEAKDTAKSASALNIDHPAIHTYLLELAFTEGDNSSAEQEIHWFVGKPEQTDMLAVQALNAYALGQRRAAKKVIQDELELLQQRKLTNRAAQVRAADGFRDALLGNCGAVRLESNVRHPDYPNILVALALCGQISEAQSLAEEILKKSRQDPRWNLWQLPTIRAALELGHNRPDKAVELLQPVAPYERTYPGAIYLRGLAYLRLRTSSEAAAEFQKILDHKGAYWMLLSAGPYYPLSYLGLARAAAMSGDTAKSKKAYQDLFALWKDADPDLAPLIQARKEYAALP